jgi:hypothetical protein
MITIAIETFFLPLTALFFTAIVSGHSMVNSPPTSGAAAAGAAIGAGLVGTMMVGVGFVLAIAIGLPCLILYFVVRPAKVSEAA